MTKKRLGKFSISARFVQCHPGLVTRIMGACIILRCEHNFMADRFEYEAISNKFEPVPEGCCAPNYEWVITKYGDMEAEKL